MMDLLEKYNVPGPRYTSYPTVPYWDENSFSKEGWIKTIKEAFWQNGKELSLYLHLPFCERLCTYCGCNTHITVNHSWEDKYIDVILQEWKLYLKHFPEKPILKELHLGGGTPTFFQPDRLEYLIENILKETEVAEDVLMGFEGHPLNTTPLHLSVLKTLGFTRLSLGIQDFDPHVQKLINRVQTVEQVKTVTNCARDLGYSSINYDLVYGLPGQASETIVNTLFQTINLLPDRIAFYGYAHVPWIKPAQKKLTPHLPNPEEKKSLYRLGKEMFSEAGYYDIGMDHFALKADPLYRSSQDGTLHRNFMGYTTQPTYFTLGLGTSAISDSWTSFAQNEKNLKEYIKIVKSGEIPVVKGHTLNREDLAIRKHILNLMCRYSTSFKNDDGGLYGWDINTSLLNELIEDELVEIDGHQLTATDKGKPYIRNICMAMDVRLWREQPDREIFSKTI